MIVIILYRNKLGGSMNYTLLILENFFYLSEKTKIFLYRDNKNNDCKKIEKIIFFIFILLILFLKTKNIYNIFLLFTFFVLYWDIYKNFKFMLTSIRGFLKYSFYFTFTLSSFLILIGDIVNSYFFILFIPVFVIIWCFISCCTEKNIGKIVNESLSIISGIILGVSHNILEISALFNKKITNDLILIFLKSFIIGSSSFFLILFGMGTLLCILKEYWLEKHFFI